jgi:hypothetical protein
VRAHGWEFGKAQVTKRQYASGDLIEADLQFRRPDTKASILLTQINSEVSAAVGGGKPQTIALRGTTATLDRGDANENPNLVVVSWHEEGKTFHATALLKGDFFTIDDFLAALESLS